MDKGQASPEVDRNFLRATHGLLLLPIGSEGVFRGGPLARASHLLRGGGWKQFRHPRESDA
jgi:hypothetical protein